MPTKRRNSRATKRTRKSQKTNEDSSPELEEYEVEEIIGRRMNGETEEFLVKWKGYSYKENTWEPLEHLSDCDSLLKLFRELPKARRTNPIKPTD